jgi:excisionase family DNA binding protein
MTSKLLDLQECAERTGTTIRWWRRAVAERRIPVVRLGRLVRVADHDLEAFIEASKEPARERRTQRLRNAR